MSEIERPHDAPPRTAKDDESAPVENRADLACDGLRRLNTLEGEEATRELLKCCGSKAWAELVSAQRPFARVSDALAAAERVWWSLGEEDWLEAFRSHPKIGEKKAELSVNPEAARWSEEEQRGTHAAAQATLAALAEANRRYMEKFGFIFIVCATGKSASEMLELLNARLANERDAELRNAAREQSRITQLRLDKLLKL